jgi:hypothetical protein
MLTLRKASLWIAGAALIPLAVGASTNLQTTIVQNGAPISIDECFAVVSPAPGGKAGYDLLESVDFTNLSQQTATNVRFSFEIVDPTGRTERTLTGDEPGRFSPGVAISHSKAQPADRGDMSQLIGTLPSIAKLFCRVLMVRFGDGSFWSEGDAPAGNAVIYTPLPGPSPSPQWQWPYDPPTPSGRSGRNLRRPSGDFESMTDQEIKPYLGKAVRVTLADRRVLAGVLHASDESGHGHRHYAIVSDAIRKGGHVAREVIHGGDQIATIEDASGDPAATP